MKWTEVAGYLHPNSGRELTNAVDHFERKSAELIQKELSIAAEVSRKSINAIEDGRVFGLRCVSASLTAGFWAGPRIESETPFAGMSLCIDALSLEENEQGNRPVELAAW